MIIMNLATKTKLFLKNSSAQAKASIAFLLAGVFQKGIQIITTPIYTRIMSTSQYGDYNTYNAWYNILSIFISLRIAYGVYTQGLVKFEKDKDQFESSLMGLTVTLSAGSAIILFILKDIVIQYTELSLPLIMCIVLESTAESFFALWARRELVETRWKALIIVSLLVSVLVPTVSIIAIIYSNDKAIARIYSTVIIYLMVYSFVAFLHFKKSKVFFRRDYWKYSVWFCLPLIPHYLSQVVLNQADRIMIKSMCGSDKSGIYSLAYSLAMVMLIVNESINRTFDPWIMKQIKTKNYKDIAKYSYVLIVLVGAANLFLICLAPEAIAIFAPQEYKEAIWVIPPVASSVFIMFLYNFFVDFEFYYEKRRGISIASICGALLNIVLNWIFIKKYGFIAAGYTTLICYIVYIIAHYCFMVNICKMELNGIRVYNGKYIFMVVMLFLIIGLGTMLLYPYTLIRYFFVGVGIVALFFSKTKIIEIFKLVKKDD